mmetsp:Transcript_6888/g.17618  ORF Transcript_6888/g.17618 Transcript_6888/m.17618 type:complete len:226 (-) Transcript_6888:254-931(-)
MHPAKPLSEGTVILQRGRQARISSCALLTGILQRWLCRKPARVGTITPRPHPRHGSSAASLILPRTCFARHRREPPTSPLRSRLQGSIFPQPRVATERLASTTTSRIRSAGCHPAVLRQAATPRRFPKGVCRPCATINDLAPVRSSLPTIMLRLGATTQAGCKTAHANLAHCSSLGGCDGIHTRTRCLLLLRKNVPETSSQGSLYILKAKLLATSIRKIIHEQYI